MSTVIDFLKAVQQDPALQEKAAAMAKKYEGRKLAEGDYQAVFAEIAPLAREAGFEISFEEYRAYLERAKNGALEDDELTAVAGGSIISRHLPKNQWPQE